jgi:hypothetical protein
MDKFLQSPDDLQLCIRPIGPTEEIHAHALLPGGSCMLEIYVQDGKIYYLDLYSQDPEAELLVNVDDDQAKHWTCHNLTSGNLGNSTPITSATYLIGMWSQ